jgi:LysM domain-containing protein
MTVPASPLQRVLAALGSLMLLLGLVAGLPVALVLLAGNPLPGDSPTVDSIWSALSSPDDGTLFLDVLAVVGWLAWAGFTCSVLLELVSRLARRSAPSIPGLRGQQRIASVLVAAVAAIAVTPTVASASAAMVDTPMAVSAPIDPARPDHGTGQRSLAGDSVLHLVERGEGLLDLQERYGVPWHRIAEANYDVEQSDGRSLQRGQTRIYAGWQLRIPTSTGIVDTSAAPITGFGSAPVPAQAPAEAQRYEVAQGDWMWHIAERYLGNPERYPEIAALNQQYEDVNGNFPDHIEPGWALALPEGAVDRGPIEHATGTASGVAQAEPDGGSGEAAPPPETEQAPPPPEAEQVPPAAEEAPPPEAEQAPPPEAIVGFGSAPVTPPAPATPPASPPASPPANPPAGAQPPADPGGRGEVDGSQDGFSVFEPDLERLAPAALAGAGLLTALVLGAAAYVQHRRHQHHRPGFRFASPSAWRLEKTLRTAQQPLDAARLDAALRVLAAGLAGRTGPLPDIAGALVDRGTLHLLLAAPCPQPPAPWLDHGDRWTLPAGAPLPAVTGDPRLAPLPTLAAIGSQAGLHLLLDLERLGFLTIYGEPARAMALLRYLAAELACNTWSDSVEILLAGFHPREAELLAAINANRVRVVPSISDAAARLRARVASARATLDHTGTPDALAGRVNGRAGDAWMPQVLLAAATSPSDLAILSQLERDLDGPNRCAVAVATMDATPPPPDQWRVTVTPDGVVHLRLPFLRASLAAAGLSVEELAPLADTMHAARTAGQVPVPPAPEPEPWAAGTDAAGSLQVLGTLAPPPWLPPEPGSPPAPVPAAPPPRTDADPTLDEDLRAWYTAGTGRPRIGVLGPVAIDAPGTMPDTRRRLHAELIVFLAQRASRGADSELIDSALWPDVHVTDAGRQLVISRARSWLGERADGTSWLPDIGPDLRYRLASGYLFDWHLFRRLRTRGEARGPDGGAEDLRAALQLIRGVPLIGADHPHAPGTRNPYPWVAESDIYPDHVIAAIVDTAHQLAEWRLAAGDPAGARWAAQQAWQVDTDRSYDQPWRDLLRAEHADGHTDRLRAVLSELMEVREAEAPEDLSPDTFRLISCWPPNVLVPTGS